MKCQKPIPADVIMLDWKEYYSGLQNHEWAGVSENVDFHCLVSCSVSQFYSKEKDLGLGELLINDIVHAEIIRDSRGGIKNLIKKDLLW